MDNITTFDTAMIDKVVLHQHCIDIAKLKLTELERIGQELKLGLSSETKSTAGDKHEVGRAMVQIQQAQNGKQVAEAQKVLQNLQAINAHQKYHAVETGSLVTTNMGLLYIAVGLGKLMIEGRQVFVIAPTAPLTQALIGNKVGSVVDFNGKAVSISQIE